MSALERENGHDPAFPMRMIGLRELRSHNSWMHNVPKLMQGGRVHAARVHPEDAAASGIEDGALCRLLSPSGSIELAAKVTDEVMGGDGRSAHGWGHRGGWRQATAAGGANVNLLASSDPADLERLAEMALLERDPGAAEGGQAAQSSPPTDAEMILARAGFPGPCFRARCDGRLSVQDPDCRARSLRAVSHTAADVPPGRPSLCGRRDRARSNRTGLSLRGFARCLAAARLPASAASAARCRTGARRRASRQMNSEMPVSTMIAPIPIAIALLLLSPVPVEVVVTGGAITGAVLVVGV